MKVYDYLLNTGRLKNVDKKYSFVLDYKDSLHTEEDLRLSLLAGATIKIGDLEIKPYSLEEIIQRYGYSKYLKTVRGILLEVSDFELEKTNPEMVELLSTYGAYTAFDLYYRFLGADFQKMLVEGLQLIFRTEDIITYPDEDYITIGKKDESGQALVINRTNFDKIVQVVKLQNYLEVDLEQVVEGEMEAKDEKTRELLEFQKKMREKLRKVKNNQQDDNDEQSDFDFSSIVSAITTKSQHIDKTNIWGMTLYQIYDEYNRLMMIDDYSTNIKAIMAGAKDVKITHWSAKPATNN